MTDLFTHARRPPAKLDLDATPTPLLDQGSVRVAYITDQPGCHSCRFWTRGTAATGTCGHDGQRKGWLTSYANHCFTYEPKEPT